ncbi:MAG: hypothetical protein AAF677_16515 [Pseudomonadota bacterium]
MVTAREGMAEFALAAWLSRDAIMEGDSVDACIRRIYDLYNHGDIKTVPNWRSLLFRARHAFSTKVARTPFALQGHDTYPTGAEIAGALGKIMEVAQEPAKITQLGTRRSRTQRAVKDLVREVRSKLAQGIFADRDSAQAYHREQKSAIEAEMLRNDPIALLGRFVWHYGMAPHRGGSAFRIYVTPKLDESAPVFCDLVRRMSGLDTVPSESAIQFPGKGKVAMPGVHSPNRTDRIVLYCKNEVQLLGGIAWLRRYQSTGASRARFDSRNPRATKPVPDLAGVAVSTQPLPNAEFMRERANIRRVKGMSFGMSRAAVIYAALEHSEREGIGDLMGFADVLERCIREAEIDIDLKRIPDLSPEVLARELGATAGEAEVPRPAATVAPAPARPATPMTPVAIQTGAPECPPPSPPPSPTPPIAPSRAPSTGPTFAADPGSVAPEIRAAGPAAPEN